MMRKVLTLAGAVFLSLTGLAAQSDPFIGTWKLNVQKSQFSPGPPPKGQTTIIEAAGNGTRHTTTGIAGNGSAISYTYTSSFDGKYEPITGTGPNGADNVAVQRPHPNVTDATYNRGGKAVQTSRTVVTKDGKLRTVTSKGINQNGQATRTVTVYDRQ